MTKIRFASKITRECFEQSSQKQEKYFFLFFCENIEENSLKEEFCDKNMKVQTPQIAWHNRERVSSVSIQPIAHPTPTKEGGTRIATGGDDTHVVVSVAY